MVKLSRDQGGFAFAHLTEVVVVVMMTVFSATAAGIAVSKIGDQDVARALGVQRAAYADLMLAEILDYMPGTDLNDQRVVALFFEQMPGIVMNPIEPLGYNSKLEIWKAGDGQNFSPVEGIDTTGLNKLGEASTGNFNVGAPQYVSMAVRDGFAFKLTVAEGE